MVAGFPATIQGIIGEQTQRKLLRVFRHMITCSQSHVTNYCERDHVIMCRKTRRSSRCVDSLMIPWMVAGKPATMDSLLVAWYTLDAMVCLCFGVKDDVLGDVLSNIY